MRGKSGKEEHTTFALPKEQHLNTGPLAMVGGTVLLKLFINLITNVQASASLWRQMLHV